jgi:pimeloyl-ACP methyl ester carboxylesterase
VIIDPEEWREKGFFLDYAGYQIFYRDSAEVHKPTLLLLHGFPTSSWDWQDLWYELTKRFRVLCFDFIGFGLSDKPSHIDYSILMQADIAQALLKHFDIDRYHLLVHDYGNSVGQELLARNEGSERSCIQSCIFLNGGLFPETHHPVLIQKLLLSPLGPVISRLTSFTKFKQNMDRICTQKMPNEVLKVHWQLLESKGGRLIMHRLIRYMEERRRFRDRWVGVLQATQVPLRLVDGLVDPISGAHMKLRYEELVPNADTVGLENTGHYPQNEAPKQVLRAANEFWQKQGLPIAQI